MMPDPQLSRRLAQAAILGVGIGIALWLILTVGQRGVYGLVSITLAIAPVAWIVFAGPRWWMLMPLTVFFGGVFALEYKIFTHEIALPLCLLALLPMIATRRLAGITRTPLPPASWMLLLLLVGNAITSLYVSHLEGIGGSGSIARIYLHGLWAVIFALAFYHFGESKPLKLLLILMYIIGVGRVLISILAFTLGRSIYVPYLNYVLGGMGQGLIDLRFTGLHLAILSFACFLWMSGKWAKGFYAAIGLTSVALVVMSAGRVSVGMVCAVPVLWALIRRKFGWVSVAGGILLVTVMFLNQRPELLYRLPSEAQRALSILIRESSTRWTDQHDMVRGSNEWHRRLMELGFSRWTESPWTVALGNRVEAYDKGYESISATMEVRAQVAARMGLYESGLWTVLCIAGLVGMLLYFRLLYFCLKGPAQELRRHGVRDVSHVFYLWAVLSTGLWGAFSWIAGGCPSFELMLAVFAKALYEDNNPGALLKCGTAGAAPDNTPAHPSSPRAEG